jgi:hypothetical protein
MIGGIIPFGEIEKQEEQEEDEDFIEDSDIDFSDYYD